VGKLCSVIATLPAIVTIGNFDGFHRGHQRLIRQVVERARIRQQQPHPHAARQEPPCRGDMSPRSGSAYNRSVIQTTQRRRITDLTTLRELVGVPSERAVRKQLAALDRHCRAFIERSPFVLLGTSGPDGRCDVSPKGDRPGFVLALDEHTIAIPDRPGNKRLDSLQNILANPHVGLLFLIPGMDETLRVNGTAELVQDDDLLDRLAVDGKRPLLVIVVHVEETFLHCARSFLRARLWDPEHFMPRTELPSLAQMIIDQTNPAGDHNRAITDAERSIGESYRCLY